MRILYLATQYDYGQPQAGHGFEYYNFYQSLQAMGLELEIFDYAAIYRQIGRRATNQRLWDIVERDQPELLFGVVRGDQLDTSTIKRITRDTDTTTINWFCDDHWQFESHARKWAPCFNWAVTTSQDALTRYDKLPNTSVIKSQWACNHNLYQPTPGPMKYDVTFVGQPYGQREAMIHALQRAGISVQVWGKGWPNGKITQQQMIQVFGQSKINLNFSDASSSQRTRLESFTRGRLIQSTRTMPGLWRVWQHMTDLTAKQKRAQQQVPAPQQIKGRVFEVTGCGGFLLTQPAENLSDYYTPGQQIGTFTDTGSLVEQVQYYLGNEEKRAVMAQSAYRRTLAEHTWHHRFEDIFRRIGLTTPRTSVTQHAA